MDWLHLMEDGGYSMNHRVKNMKCVTINKIWHVRFFVVPIVPLVFQIQMNRWRST